MPLVSIKSEDKILSSINQMSELELCTFLEKLNELIIDRRQKHLIIQCFGVEDEDMERERNEYKEKLDEIEMAWMCVDESKPETLKTFYDDVNSVMPV